MNYECCYFMMLNGLIEGKEYVVKDFLDFKFIKIVKQ